MTTAPASGRVTVDSTRLTGATDDERSGDQPHADRPRTLGALRRQLDVVRARRWRVAVAIGAGAAAELGSIGLMATAGWLIAPASQQPELAVLSLAIVLVRAFAVSRGALRYGERLASHDAALRALATMRGRVYDALVPLAPGALPAFRSSD